MTNGRLVSLKWDGGFSSFLIFNHLSVHFFTFPVLDESNRKSGEKKCCIFEKKLAGDNLFSVIFFQI